ncbi:hypothetical protein JW935_27525, partial [candidate division KSB1 bacterium]|nr:hypothetical protein [candidate division KSB1 bacterium]
MMNQKFGKKESCFNFWLFLFFSVITWIYLWLFVDPALLFQRQQPAFYFDYLFLQRFTVYPGGLMQYFSAFLAQLYLIPAVGAAVIVLVLSGIAYFTHRFFRSTGGYTGTSVIAFLPSIILLVMHTDYNFSLNGSLGLLAALSIFTAFTASFSSRKYLINILFLLLFPFLYYCFGAPVLYCALLAGLYVMTTKTTVFWRRLVFTLACYILACCVPFLSIANYTIASVFERLTSNLVLPEHTDPDWLPYLLYGFYPAGLIIMRLFTIRTGSKPAPGGEKLKRAPQKKRKGLSEITKFSLNLTVLFLATAIPAFIFYNPTAKFNLKIEYLARGKNWQKVLQTVKGYPHLNFYTAAQVNRALYHSGRLLETMFYWPQEWGSNGLLIPQEYGYAFPMQISDLFFDMGGITEAQHWAYEAQAVYIDSPWNIQRLFLTHVLKRNNIAALRYLTYISKSPLFKNWAKRHEIFLDDPA